MNALIQNVVYKSDKGTPVTDSLKVAEAFGKEHKMILRAIRNILGDPQGTAQNCAVVQEGGQRKIVPTAQESNGRKIAPVENEAPAHRKWFYETTYYDAKGEERPIFLMNRDGFSLLAMGLTGAQAMQFKVKFIEQFNAMEQHIREQQSSQQLPQSFAEALRLAAEQAERMEQQQKQIAEMQPKAVFADAVKTSDRSILIAELAKLLKQNGVDMGQNRLFHWLRSNGYLCTRGDYYNQPTQRAMELGLFEVKKTIVNKPDGTSIVSATTKVSGKGQVYFVNKFLNSSSNGRADRC